MKLRFSDCGKFWIGNTRPFTKYREIKKGTNKGKIEITLPECKVIINKNQIERWPKGE